MNALVAPLRNIVGYRELIWELARRDLRDRHAGQSLGVIWAYGYPLLLMMFYTVLFAYVFPARFGGTVQVVDYSPSILAGLISWLTFQDVLSRSPFIILQHRGLVKQIAFPVQLLPVKSTIASTLTYLPALVFVIGYCWWLVGPSWLLLTLPIVIAMQWLAMTGTAFFLASVGVFFRDIRDIVSVFCMVNLFAQPILFNPLHDYGPLLGWTFVFNPFSYLVWCWQDILFFREFRHSEAWLVLPVLSLMTFAIGLAMFSTARHHFGDSL